jgi:hypothetical protein
LGAAHVTARLASFGERIPSQVHPFRESDLIFV